MKILHVALLMVLGTLQIHCFDVKSDAFSHSAGNADVYQESDTVLFTDEKSNDYTISILNPTFMGNSGRNYYGDSLPSRLDVIWKCYLGYGKTGAGKDSVATWAGAGWTGQPLMVLENGVKYIIQGAYDHNLKKIDSRNGRVVWQYAFDDVIKGTGTLWYNREATTLKEKLLILQGSRASFYRSMDEAPSYRAVSYFTGEELWRLPSRRTLSYSRDNDASALIIRDTAYIGFENGIFHIFDPAPQRAHKKFSESRPMIFRDSDTLYNPKDTLRNGHNLVTEASPAFANNHVYLASGSGKVYGYNLGTKKIDWIFTTGSDIDGSPVVTSDGCMLISIEKQFIRGQGGLLKLDPRKNPSDAIVWYYPTGNKGFASWDGGIIGTASTNESTKNETTRSLAVCSAIDGFLSVVDLNNVEPGKSVISFDGRTQVPTPRIVFKYQTGPSISSPIFVGNRIAALGYKGFFLFEHDNDLKFRLISNYPVYGEATPFADAGRIYVASRDGNLYCFGEKAKPAHHRKDAAK